MLCELKRCYPKETGGVLMGQRNDNNIILSHYIGPGPKAIHKHFSFMPDDKYQQQEISKIYTRTNREITYLGDWHSHPYNKAYLSGMDKDVLKKIADYNDARLADPVMIIIGTRPFETSAWIYHRKGYQKTSVFQRIEIELKI